MRPGGRARAGAARNLLSGALAAAFAFALAGGAVRGQSAPSRPSSTVYSTTWTVTIVLPPRLVAGQPATLAVLGTDGKLARNVAVDLGSGLQVRTDPIGRAYFTVPSGAKVLLAKSTGSSTAALIDSASPPPASYALRMAPQVSIKDTATICGGPFTGDAEANAVQLGGEPALVLAASPECLVVLASPQARPGRTQVTVRNSLGSFAAETTLVALADEPPQPPLVAQKKSALGVLAEGSADPLRIHIHNETPGVLRFLRGDDQELTTSGGVPNAARFEVEALRSGDFSFHAWIVPPANPAEAQLYLDAAIPIAGESFGKELKKLSDQLRKHPKDAPKVAARLDSMLNVVIAGDLRTLLAAARNAL